MKQGNFSQILELHLILFVKVHVELKKFFLLTFYAQCKPSALDFLLLVLTNKNMCLYATIFI